MSMMCGEVYPGPYLEDRAVLRQVGRAFRGMVEGLISSSTTPCAGKSAGYGLADIAHHVIQHISNSRRLS